MPILRAKAIEGYKKYTETTIAYAKYKIGGEYKRTEISRRERLKDGSVAVYLNIDAPGGKDVTVTEVQLYDTNNDIWAAKVEDIVIRGVQEGVLYRFTFDFREV